jgi:transcriptional regulator with XRE-family HTH domain
MAELAAAADADPALLQALEQGEAGPTYLLLLRVADALGTPASELVLLAEREADSTPSPPTAPEAE